MSLPREDHEAFQSPEHVDARLEQIIATCSGPKFIYRTARHDLDLGRDQPTIPVTRGDTLRLSVHALNRTTRNGAGHASFGQGIHRCIGAGLARLTMRRAIPALFARFPYIALVPQGQRYFPMSQMVALRSLPCTLTNGSD